MGLQGDMGQGNNSSGAELVSSSGDHESVDLACAMA